ncbi:polysaccharide deacetylase family protein [Irregularibacter muris]|uniref:Polysaccharide deacetylase family protein n=1 Tax=Irregularibacter muris TaxID=1796619 RepID=A0AAE3L3E0_9FIRM|nr:polysaccharide deacetylase family protein [Irregularibacter muris]MCR1898098.1 polysaccharide deacetylase family protein [Irregularibacter muris]
MKMYFIPFNKKLFIIIGIIIVAILIISATLLSPQSISIFNPKPIYEVETGRDEIALTCNVVWGTEFIPPMLDILKNENVKMTFYIGGKWAEDNPELLKRIFSEGHEIGNHGYDHKKHTQLNDTDNTNEIVNAEEAIYEVLGFKTNLFAPPYGDINEKTTEIAEKLGYKVIMWSIDTIDWKYKDPKVIYDRVFKQKLEGGIVLTHPTDGTVKALPSIIKTIKEKNVDLVTVSELIKE